MAAPSFDRNRKNVIVNAPSNFFFFSPSLSSPPEICSDTVFLRFSWLSIAQISPRCHCHRFSAAAIRRLVASSFVLQCPPSPPLGLDKSSVNTVRTTPLPSRMRFSLQVLFFPRPNREAPPPPPLAQFHLFFLHADSPIRRMLDFPPTGIPWNGLVFFSSINQLNSP